MEQFILEVEVSEYGHLSIYPMGIYDTVELAKEAVQTAIDIDWDWEDDPDVLDGVNSFRTNNNSTHPQMEWIITGFEKNSPLVLPGYVTDSFNIDEYREEKARWAEEDDEEDDNQEDQGGYVIHKKDEEY